MDKSSPTSTLSEKANRPSLKISTPTRPSTPAELYSEETVAMGSLPDENILPSERTSSSTTGISFSELCNPPPRKFTVPTSPPPGAYEWYYLDQPEETAPPNLSDTAGDTIDSLLDSYLSQYTQVAPDSPLSDYSPKDETSEEDSDNWDDTRPGPYRAEDFLECLYDAYLDEDMTSELVDK